MIAIEVQQLAGSPTTNDSKRTDHQRCSTSRQQQGTATGRGIAVGGCAPVAGGCAGLALVAPRPSIRGRRLPLGPDCQRCRQQRRKIATTSARAEAPTTTKTKADAPAATCRKAETRQAIPSAAPQTGSSTTTAGNATDRNLAHDACATPRSRAGRNEEAPAIQTPERGDTARGTTGAIGATTVPTQRRAGRVGNRRLPRRCAQRYRAEQALSAPGAASAPPGTERGSLHHRARWLNRRPARGRKLGRSIAGRCRDGGSAKNRWPLPHSTRNRSRAVALLGADRFPSTLTIFRRSRH